MDSYGKYLLDITDEIRRQSGVLSMLLHME